jgi:hypothetical protein
MIDAFRTLAPLALWLFGVGMGITGLVVLSWGWPYAVPVAVMIVGIVVAFTGVFVCHSAGRCATQRVTWI